MSEKADLILMCVECKEQFSVPAGEQEWLAQKFGMDYSPPKRCRTCRVRRKAEREKPQEE